MSLLRSPTNTATGGGSQPDLSKLSNMEADPAITFRKRKKPLEHDCKCCDELKELRFELSRTTLLLEKYSESNEKIMTNMKDNITEVKAQMAEMKATSEKSTNLISENITEIKDQISTIKTSSLNITMEQNKIKKQVALLETKMSVSENKIKTLESNINQCSSVPSGRIVSEAHLSEELIREVQERNERERNIIIVGLPEQTTANATERASNDEADVMQITRSIVLDTPQPLKVIRIGKYNDNKIRRVKVCYESKYSAKQLLRNRSKLPEHIKIYSDQTPAQQKYLQNLKKELASRASDGEANLTIKYINGIPNIVKENPKNFQ